MKLSKRAIPFLIVCAVGILCSCVLLFGRLTAEENDRKVAVAIEYEDVLELSEKNETEPSEWLRLLKENGVHFLIITDENELQGKALANQLGLKTARSGDTAKAGDAFLLPPVEDYVPTAYDAPKGTQDVPLALVENKWRTGVIMPEDFDPDQWDGSMVKTVYMIDAYRYHYEMQEPATENENIIFRAVMERGMRLVILAPLIQEGDEAVVADPLAYTDLLQGLGKRIADRGLVLGDEFSAMDAPKTNPLLLGGASLLLVTAVVLLFLLLFKIPAWLEWSFLTLGSLLGILGTILMPFLMQRIVAFGAAVVFPCLAVLFLKKGIHTGVFVKCRLLVVRYLLLLLCFVLIGILSGAYISALLSTRHYMMQFTVFSGVKLSQLLPIGFSVLVMCQCLLEQKELFWKKKMISLPQLIAVLFGIAAVLVVMILRSGDNMLPVLNLEKDARNWMEYVLYVRPRTKEMLLAFPSVALYLIFASKKKPLLQFAFGVVASIGAASIVNTFCHTFTPFRVSLIRTLFGMGIGGVLGVAAIGLFYLLFRRKPGSKSHAFLQF